VLLFFRSLESNGQTYSIGFRTRCRVVIRGDTVTAVTHFRIHARILGQAEEVVGTGIDVELTQVPLLQELGIKAVRGPRTVTEDFLKYINKGKKR
jgi:hypothetical protein